MLKGGEFLVSKTKHNDLFIPEEWSEEQLMIRDMVKDFCDQEILQPMRKSGRELDASKDRDEIIRLLDKSAELGLCGLSIPQEYGGMDLDFNTGLLFGEAISNGFSFATTIGAQTSIGSLPIVYYGTPAQKEKYLPKIGSAEYKASYALTEPGAGSDANSGKTKATLTADGKNYLLNGQKMWITNGGFADIFIVFAKIEDDKNLSAFIVEKAFGGITLGEEEKKLGIKGSSTVQVFFNDCPVPTENILAERGDGFKIALNILNSGRIKLSAGSIGGAKYALSQSINYSNERKQFEKSIAEFGAIKFKIGEMATKIFATESAIYRTGKYIDEKEAALIDAGKSKSESKVLGLREYAIECALLKVYGTEVLDYCIDETLQIYGGMGYSAEAGIEMGYRDSRITRIYEGTNEINRMLTVDMVLRRAMKGELDLMGPAMKVAGDLMSIPEIVEPSDAPLGNEEHMVDGFKKAILMVAGSAVQKLMQSLAKEQEVLMNIADMAIWTYLAESVYLRVQKKIDSQGEAACEHDIAIAKTYFYDIADKIAKAAKDAINSYAEGDEARMMLMGLKRFTKTQPFNPKAARQIIAQKLIEDGRYKF